jgi:predicted anti-sigma-YlaC factor YlaD
MMNCELARDLLPLALTGDLEPAQSTALDEHLASCAACRRERAALQSVRAALDAPATPNVSVDVAAIWHDAAARQNRSLRRWRRVAVAGGALAASLLLLALLRVDIQLGNGQLVLSWGAPTEVPAPGRPVDDLSVAIAKATAACAELEERAKVLGQLVAALRDDFVTRDRQRQTEIAVLVSRLEMMRDREQRRWEENRRDLTALYTAQFGQGD